MSACPTCGKDVDALRARNVKVRGVQVVAYCSPECLAAAGDSTATAIPPTTGKAATPPQGVVKQGQAPDSGPVIEIRYEPASGVVTSAKDERKTPLPEPLVKPSEPKADEKKAGKDKAKAAKRETAPSERRPVLKIIEEAGGAPRDIKAPKDAPKDAPKEAAQKDEPAKVSPAKLSDAAAALPPVGKRRATRDTLERDRSNVGQAEDWLEDEPANVADARPGTDLPDDVPKGGSKRAALWLLVLVLLAGAGVLAYKLLYLDRAKPAAKPGSSVGQGSSGSATGSQREPRPAGVGSGSQLAEPRLRVEEIRDRALGLLRRHLEDNSPRIQVMAAAALARTGDQAAKDRLIAALDTAKLGEVGHLEVAYFLARAGEKRGLDRIVSSLGSPRRDDKLIAGRLLVQLGDTRAVNTLAAYLGVPQHRLSAAEWLARLGEPRAIKVLEQVRADPAATPDDKARAVIGLAFAGKSGLGEELRALLARTHFNAFAAEALAQKRDEAARPVLAEQLEVTSLRVGAARALRMLSPDGDPQPYLESLGRALDDPALQRDIELIPIAEAILILLGPIEWSERP